MRLPAHEEVLHEKVPLHERRLRRGEGRLAERELVAAEGRSATEDSSPTSHGGRGEDGFALALLSARLLTTPGPSRWPLPCNILVSATNPAFATDNEVTTPSTRHRHDHSHGKHSLAVITQRDVMMVLQALKQQFLSLLVILAQDQKTALFLCSLSYVTFCATSARCRRSTVARGSRKSPRFSMT